MGGRSIPYRRLRVRDVPPCHLDGGLRLGKLPLGILMALCRVKPAAVPYGSRVRCSLIWISRHGMTRYPRNIQAGKIFKKTCWHYV